MRSCLGRITPFRTDRRLLFESEFRPDTVARIDQQRQAQRQIAFRRELLDKLRFIVLPNLEVVDREVGYEPAFLIGDGKENIHVRNAGRKFRFRQAVINAGGSGGILLGKQSSSYPQRQTHRHYAHNLRRKITHTDLFYVNGTSEGYAQQGADTFSANRFHLPA